MSQSQAVFQGHFKKCRSQEFCLDGLLILFVLQNLLTHRGISCWPKYRQRQWSNQCIEPHFPRHWFCDISLATFVKCQLQISIIHLSWIIPYKMRFFPPPLSTPIPPSMTWRCNGCNGNLDASSYVSLLRKYQRWGANLSTALKIPGGCKSGCIKSTGSLCPSSLIQLCVIRVGQSHRQQPLPRVPFQFHSPRICRRRCPVILSGRRRVLWYC